MRIPELLLALLLFASFTALADSEALLDAKYRYDLDAAQSVLADTAPAAGLEFAEASLLVAELLRGRYEHDELGRDGRREVGREIDRVAEAALAVLETLPQSSERYRLAADLYGTLIRSRFRGMKYQPKLEQAVDKALELDPKNAHAWVTKARRPLFAKPRHGGDPVEALKYLNKALAEAPDHVQALLFRGTAFAKLDEMENAELDWNRATAINPSVAAARDRLLAIAVPGDEGAAPAGD